MSSVIEAWECSVFKEYRVNKNEKKTSGMLCIYQKQTPAKQFITIWQQNINKSKGSCLNLLNFSL